MGYNKLIAYGQFIELYEYEKNLSQRLSKSSRSNESRIRVQDLVVNATDVQQELLQESSYQKRQDHARRSTMDFRRLVSSNLGGVGNPILITFTYSENITDIRQGYKDFRSYTQRMRCKFGKSFRYIVVPEFQKRGAVHFHALYWGLPTLLFESERQTRLVASLWACGFVYMKQTDGDDRLSTYLSKYMSKAFKDRRLKNQKAYVSSRNILRPIVKKDFSPSWPVIDDWVGDNLPCKDIFFGTKWLGKGRFRLYDLKNNIQKL